MEIPSGDTQIQQSRGSPSPVAARTGLAMEWTKLQILLGDYSAAGEKEKEGLKRTAALAHRCTRSEKGGQGHTFILPVSPQ